MIWLVELHDEHPREFEHELIKMGLRWRDFPNRDFTWSDLAAIIHCSPPDGPLRVALDPENAVSTETQFMRSMEHSLRWLVWSRSTAAKSSQPPEPWRFVWEQGEDEGYQTDEMTMEEAADFLGWADLIAAENARRAEAGQKLIPV